MDTTTACEVGVAGSTQRVAVQALKRLRSARQRRRPVFGLVEVWRGSLDLRDPHYVTAYNALANAGYWRQRRPAGQVAAIDRAIATLEATP